ncbi:MAG: hypothetical protein HQL52_17070 [Magnetococcales bacterium]|nr:hypothetical protein [Magnetococcales bacterium]
MAYFSAILNDFYLCWKWSLASLIIFGVIDDSENLIVVFLNAKIEAPSLIDAPLPEIWRGKRLALREGCRRFVCNHLNCLSAAI